MKIVLTADPEIPVPPKLYGGIERIIDMLIVDYRRLGHEVTLFSHADSTADCERIAWRGKASTSKADTIKNVLQLRQYVKENATPDTVLHSFSRLAYLLPLLRRPTPLIQSYQRDITVSSHKWGTQLAKNLTFTACSRSCALSGGGYPAEVIYNGVPLERYPFAAEVAADAPLVFLGRMEKIKGPHTAVQVAKKTGRRLILAGNISPSPVDREFVDREVLAHCDGKQISYIGPVDDAQKGELLRNAAALLFPIEWEEPFGIVMVESLVCGTPVLAHPRGAVPEVITDGVDGFVCRDVEALCAAVGRIKEISRKQCRATVEKRFSDKVIAGQYLDLYRRVLAK